MTLVFVLVTVLVVVAIGLVSVGRVTATLAIQPPPSLFDLEEAVEYVSERLPYEVSAQLSYDDVRQLIEWHVAYLEAKGIAVADEADLLERAEAVTGPVVAEDDEGVAFVLGKAGETDLDVTDEQVVVVVEIEMAYLGAIGALGTPVRPSVDPIEPAGPSRPDSGPPSM